MLENDPKKDEPESWGREEDETNYGPEGGGLKKESERDDSDAVSETSDEVLGDGAQEISSEVRKHYNFLTGRLNPLIRGGTRSG